MRAELALAIGQRSDAQEHAAKLSAELLEMSRRIETGNGSTDHVPKYEDLFPFPVGDAEAMSVADSDSEEQGPTEPAQGSEEHDEAEELSLRSRLARTAARKKGYSAIEDRSQK